MKKRISMLLLASVMMLGIVGCGGTTEETDSGEVINTKYSEETMNTITGKEIDIANSQFALGASAYGYTMVYPESWKSIPEMNLYLARDEGVCVASYLPDSVVQTLTAMANQDMTEEEMAQASDLIGESLIPVAALYAAEKDGKKPSVAASYDRDETITEANGYVYRISYNTKVDTTGLSEGDVKNLDILLKSVDEMTNNVMIFPPQQQSASFPGTLENLKAEDMSGKKVDVSLFADYDLTMVNIWTTWCGYCIDEMDELETLYQGLPDNVNMITICGDANEEKELAQEILDKNGATFQTLVANEQLQKDLLEHVSGFPTTVFVDKNGKVVGDIQQGAPGKDVIAGYERLIEAHLAALDKGEGVTP